jgi:uroporphyrinogen-III synthase
MRVLITRPQPDAGRTAAALAERGHIAVLAPVTEIRTSGAALPGGSFDAIAATSHHAFAAPEGLDRRLPVFAVGGRTAAEARAAGFRDVRVGRGDAAGLADLLRLTLPRPARLLYLAGRDRKPLLEEAVAAAGYGIAVAEVYGAEPLPGWPAEAEAALRGRAVDAALHYSRRSVDLTLALAARTGLEDAVLLLRHFCLSGDCAEPLMERRAFSVAVADRPDEDALLALLDAVRR